MRILIVTATTTEIKPFLKELKLTYQGKTKVGFYKYKDLLVDVLITGVGMPSTTYNLVKFTQHVRYNLILNVGIAGSFKPEIGIGEVVNVVEEQFGDVGVEDDNDFITSFELQLEDPNLPPWKDGKLINNDKFCISILDDLRKVKGITVNKTHGSQQSIDRIRTKLNPDVETMEGAAVFYCCLMEKLPFFEIRAISNIVEPRNVKNWDIPKAIANLNTTIISILEELNKGI